MAKLTLELLDELIEISTKDHEQWIKDCESNPEFVRNMNLAITHEENMSEHINKLVSDFLSKSFGGNDLDDGIMSGKVLKEMLDNAFREGYKAGYDDGVDVMGSVFWPE